MDIDDTIKKKIDEKLRECSSGDSDSDSDHNVYMQKAVDLPSAQRLAKRLYYLDGFKANDVVRHLSKKWVSFFLYILRVLISILFVNKWIWGVVSKVVLFKLQVLCVLAVLCFANYFSQYWLSIYNITFSSVDLLYKLSVY